MSDRRGRATSLAEPFVAPPPAPLPAPSLVSVDSGRDSPSSVVLGTSLMAAEFSRKTREICYHGVMESARTPTQLQREVLPPQKAEQGLSVLVLVSTAMFCAILSSALMLQARNARHCPGMQDRAYEYGNDVDVSVELEAERIISVDELHIPPRTNALVEVIEIGDLDPATAQPLQGMITECGKPMYQKNADGSVTAVYTICPQGADGSWNIKSADPDRIDRTNR